jgi:Calcineurin-like phosphoesterase
MRFSYKMLRGAGARLLDGAGFVRDDGRLPFKFGQALRWCLIPWLTAAGLTGQSLTPAWVELGAGGQVLARIVVGAPQDCPAIRIDGRALPMPVRQPVPEGLRPACEATIPAGTKSAIVNGRALALPRGKPSRVVAMGDTGCRIKGAAIQGCNDPALWPFAEVSTRAAAERADLVIHVGDYLYRESPCPAASAVLCGGTPSGDNWDAWNADFFTPAAKLLAAAPWAFSRGNHEDCSRSWRGWFYYLDPRPWNGTCEKHSAPYVIKLGSFALIMLDSASVAANALDPDQAALYAKQLQSVKSAGSAKGGVWLADHHPFWGMRTDGPTGKPLAVTPTLEEAWEGAPPQGISLVLSGHVHLFELLSFAGARPVQLVAGDGGTQLANPIETSIQGVALHGGAVVASESQHQFGYTLLTRHRANWDLVLKNRMQEGLLHCVISPEPPRTKCRERGSL